MLHVLGGQTKLCDGIKRRELLRVGGLSLFAGMNWPRLLRAAEKSPRRDAHAKSVIIFNLLGGPSQLDMFDMKPLAPREVRGEFQPISTSVSGVDICEHMPRIARLMHKACLIRSVTHSYNAHNPLPVVTGFTGGRNEQLRPDPTDPPDIGAICQYLGMGPRDLPGAVCLPCYPGWGESSEYPGIRRPGPYGGFLGSRYDPLFGLCSPTFDRKPTIPHYDPVTPIGEPKMPSLDALPQMTADRMDRRRSVLSQIDRQFAAVQSSPAVERMAKDQQRAFSMLCSSKTRDAFDLSKESSETRERYGRNMSGSSLLVARRLVEADVPYVSVHAEIFGKNGHSYDTHENNFEMLKRENMPILDRGFSALLEDLDRRGRLDSTLLVVMGEMGRSSRVNSVAGRDHWPQCGFCLLAGGGIRPGIVFGQSDRHATYPDRNPVSPGDIVATIYDRLGIDPHLMVPDMTGRPIGISHGGEPIHDIMV